ncbi:MAG TPA: hypothetical protein VNG13_01930 [Mycobacteriales bacterium]|nr:hypothetical protein [Mycobacteriales bacterium]
MRFTPARIPGPRRRGAHSSLGIGLAGVGLLAAACGGAGASVGTGGSASTPPVASASTPPVASATTSIGGALVDSHGRTLYELSDDRPGHLACVGGCLSVWKLATVPAGTTTVTAGAGVTAQLTTLARGSQLQIVANGMPLYTFAGDSGNAQTNGEGIVSFGGTWYVVSSAGAALTAAAPSATTSSSSGGGYGGY